MRDTLTLLTPPATASLGDTVTAPVESETTDRPSTSSPALPQAPRTAPPDRAAAPALQPLVVDAAPAVAPETATITPPAVSTSPASSTSATDSTPVRRPFSVGERLTYDVRFGPLPVGTATLQVLDIAEVRGRPAYHVRFDVRGGNRLYRVEDSYESWFDARTLASLRYAQNIRQGDYRRQSTFEIFPEEQRYVEAGKEPQPSVPQPLDEGSFLYWLRTIPLEVGRTYTFDNYFRPDRNPVTITVVRRERVKVPAGEFDAVVVRPTIKTRGIFSEGGRAEIWFADDSTRRILQLKSRLSFGSLNLFLK